MPEETFLKKEFASKDVNRMRNIINKKFGNSTTTQIGYSKIEEDHKEGDIWKENDIEWVIKDGLKQRYNRLRDLKKAIIMPLFCPNCKTPMNHPLDKKMYNIHSKCFDCVVKMETKMRFEGTYTEYSKNIITNNIIHFVDEAKDVINEYKNADENMYTEHGDKQKFVGGIDKEKVTSNWLEELNKLEENVKSQIL